MWFAPLIKFENKLFFFFPSTAPSGGGYDSDATNERMERGGLVQRGGNAMRSFVRSGLVAVGTAMQWVCGFDLP